MLSCVSLSMCSRISASSSSIIRLPRPMNPLLLHQQLLFHWPKNPCDCPRQLVPFAGFQFQSLPAFARQPVELGAPVVFRRALFHGNPSTFDEPVQRRIERALLHL